MRLLFRGSLTWKWATGNNKEPWRPCFILITHFSIYYSSNSSCSKASVTLNVDSWNGHQSSSIKSHTPYLYCTELKLGKLLDKPKFRYIYIYRVNSFKGSFGKKKGKEGRRESRELTRIELKKKKIRIELSGLFWMPPFPLVGPIWSGGQRWP